MSFTLGRLQGSVRLALTKTTSYGNVLTTYCGPKTAALSFASSKSVSKVQLVTKAYTSVPPGRCTQVKRVSISPERAAYVTFDFAVLFCFASAIEISPL